MKDVNNNPPEFSKESYDVAVSENLASGASILTLEVTDKDEVSYITWFYCAKLFGIYLYNSRFLCTVVLSQVNLICMHNIKICLIQHPLSSDHRL